MLFSPLREDQEVGLTRFAVTYQPAGSRGFDNDIREAVACTLLTAGLQRTPLLVSGAVRDASSPKASALEDFNI